MDTSDMKKCPQCAEQIKAEALVCRYCGTRFDTNLITPSYAYPPPPAPGYPGVPGPYSPTAPGALPSGVRLASPWLRLGAYLLEGLLTVVTVGIGWLIWACFTGPTGQTPAKRLLNIRVIRADTLRPAGLARMFWVRGLLAGFVAYFAVAFTLGILLFMPFWDRQKQNIWDKVSNCYVVTDPFDAWNTRPDLRTG